MVLLNVCLCRSLRWNQTCDKNKHRRRQQQRKRSLPKPQLFLCGHTGDTDRPLGTTSMVKLRVSLWFWSLTSHEQILTGSTVSGGKAILWLSPQILAASARLQKCLLDGRVVVNSNIFYPSLLLQLLQCPLSLTVGTQRFALLVGVLQTAVCSTTTWQAAASLWFLVAIQQSAPDRGGVLTALHPLWLFHTSQRAGCGLWQPFSIKSSF